VLFYLLVVFATIPSPMVSFAEPWIILIGLNGERVWWVVGLCMALGQTIGFAGFYLFGDAIVGRIPRLRRKLDTMDVAKFREKAPVFLVVGSIVGLPPHFAQCTVSPLVGIPFWRLMAVTWAGRSIRFCTLAGLPTVFADLFGTGWLPEWLKTIS
jgi:membrane protein YqaA with SNARE-associated domain